MVIYFIKKNGLLHISYPSFQVFCPTSLDIFCPSFSRFLFYVFNFPALLLYKSCTSFQRSCSTSKISCPTFFKFSVQFYTSSVLLFQVLCPTFLYLLYLLPYFFKFFKSPVLLFNFPALLLHISCPTS